VGISLNWLIKILGRLLGGGALPIVCILLWDRTSTFAVIVSPIIGLVSGLTSWMVATNYHFERMEFSDRRLCELGDGCCKHSYSYLPGTEQEEIGGFEATEVDSKGNTVPEKIDVPNDMEQAPNDKPAGKVVEENAATEELKPIEGEEYVAEEALTPEEVSSQKILAWSTLIIGTLVFMIVSLFSYPSAIASLTNQ
jgi:hypothetical protein